MTVRKLIIGVIGYTILGVGILLIVLPGPAFIFIPLGVAILALEFSWAKRLLQWLRAKLGGSRKHPHRSE